MEVIVHGGAGDDPGNPDARQESLDRAAEKGTLSSDPLSAVEAAIRVLESDPKFNAGRGSAVQSDGRIRTDAGVMTSDGEVGAACSMQDVEHAISAARAVHRETPHVLVSGAHAVALAADHSIEHGCDLWTERTRERWEAVGEPPGDTPRAHLAWLRSKFGDGRNGGDDAEYDTVGAVARHDDEFAAGTSTGGRWFALAGRVGDVPQVGSGFYCTAAGGASVTGAGEQIARTTLAQKAVGYLEAGHGAQTAARFALNEFEDRVGADASVGIILVGEDGTGSIHNTESMGTAIATDD